MRIALIALTGLLLTATGASAQSATSDVVRLADGSFYRGTIVESTPDHVALLMPSGETHTFARTDIASAGPEEPPLPDPMPLPAPPTTHVHATTDGTGLSLHYVSGRTDAAVGGAYGSVRFLQIDQFTPLCYLPCDVDVRPDFYRLAVARGAERPRPVGAQLTLSAGDLDLFVHHESREGIRIVGLTTLFGGLVGGLVLIFVGWLGDTPTICPGAGPCFHSGVNVAEMVSGGAVAAAALAVGLPLTFWNDGFELHASVGGLPIGE